MARPPKQATSTTSPKEEAESRPTIDALAKDEEFIDYCIDYLISSVDEHDRYSEAYHSAKFQRSLEKLHLGLKKARTAWASMEADARNLFFSVEWDGPEKTVVSQDFEEALTNDIEQLERYFQGKQTRRGKRPEFELVYLILSKWTEITGRKPTVIVFGNRNDQGRKIPALPFVEAVIASMKKRALARELSPKVQHILQHLLIPQTTEQVIKTAFSKAD